MRILSSAFIFGTASFVRGSVDTPAIDIFDWFVTVKKLQKLRATRDALVDDFRDLYGTDPASRNWKALNDLDRVIRDMNLIQDILQLELDEINAHIDANRIQP